MSKGFLGAVTLVLAGVLQAAAFPGLKVQAQSPRTHAQHQPREPRQVKPAKNGGAKHGPATVSPQPVPLMKYASSIRRPQGIYAVVVMDHATDVVPLLNNPAVSGLAIRMFWSTLQPAKDRYDFNSLDLVFNIAKSAQKTIQLILVPGFGTPDWVLSELSSCDDLLTGSVAGGGKGGGGGGKGGGHAGKGKSKEAGGGAGKDKDAGGHGGKTGKHSKEKPVPGRPGAAVSSGAPKCGKASFDASEGAGHGTQFLPLPWNPVYKRYWKDFLTEVAKRYGSRDTFVSIAVAGPSAESVETILPRTGNQLDHWGQLLQLFYTDAAYHQSDQAFIDEWNAAATVYGELFRNITIVLTRGSGMLDFTKGQGKAAEESIVSWFASHALGTNAKATQTSGMKACRETKEGIKGVKATSSDAAYSPPILGGTQFNTSFSQKPALEGCPSSCDETDKRCKNIAPEEALSNVLKVYFDDTPDGAEYGASKGSARMNYLQVYEKDIMYANSTPTVLSILKLASQQLLKQAR